MINWLKGKMVQFEPKKLTKKDLDEYVEKQKHILPKGACVCINKDEDGFVIDLNKSSPKEYENFIRMSKIPFSGLDGTIRDHCGGTYRKIEE